MKIKFLSSGFAAFVVAMGCVSSAFATPILMLSVDNGAWQTIYGSPASQDIAFTGALGGRGLWVVSVSGSVGSGPELALNSVDARSRLGGGDLRIRLVETGVTALSPGGFWENEVNGTVGNLGVMSVNTYLDPNNGDFTTMPASAISLTSQSFAGGAIGATVDHVGDVSAWPFSLMVEVSVSHRLGARTVFSDSLVDPDPPQVPDGGATIMLLGMALGALGLFSRSRRDAA